MAAQHPTSIALPEPEPAMSDNPLTDFPELDYTPEDEPTQPLPLMERAQPRSAQDEIALNEGAHPPR